MPSPVTVAPTNYNQAQLNTVDYAATTPKGTTRVTVQPGDTISAIMAKNGYSYDNPADRAQFFKNNPQFDPVTGTRNPDLIWPGETLNVRTPRQPPKSDGNGGLSQQLADSLNHISPDGVDQGGVGDCVFEACLAALASTPKGQQQIKNMIKPSSDGDGYTVTFPGDPGNPVHVTNEDLAKSKAVDSALWAKVIETAMEKQYPSVASGGNPPAGSAKNPDGSDPTPAQYCQRLLTGHDAKKVDAASPDAKSFITNNLAAGNPVTAFCKDNDGGALISGHEWTVMKIDPKTGEVTLRNPWGKNNNPGQPAVGKTKNGVTNMGNGEMKMSWDTYQKYFAETTSTVA